MSDSAVVSVVVPMLDEEVDIAGCIDAVAAQDVGAHNLELILVDGCSSDGTVAVSTEAAARHRFLRVVHLTNPRRRTSVSLNVGLAAATGKYLVRVDARSRIQPHYVRTCTAALDERRDVGVVGGAQIARARSARAVEVGIARALRNKWATGLSRYRRGSRSGPSDTVWMGVFRTAELRRLGGWDEAVALNEDYELASRYRTTGALVWFEGSLRSEYLPRRGLRPLGLQYLRFGRVKGIWWARRRAISVRHGLLLALPPLALTGLTLAVSHLGWGVAVALVMLTLAALDTLGGAAMKAGPLARSAAASAIVVITAAWWVGVVAGALHEVLGSGRQEV